MPELPDDPGLYDSLRRVSHTARAVFEPSRLTMVRARTDMPARILLLASGEALAAAQLAAAVLANEATQPIAVCHDRQVPRWVGPEDLVIVCSLSGNSPECVAAIANASDREASLAVVTAGGHLLDMALSQGYPVADLSLAQNHGVLAFAALLFGILGLTAAASVPNGGRGFAGDVESAIALLERLRDAYGPSSDVASNPARLVAGALADTDPVLVGTPGIASDICAVIERRFRQIGRTKITAAILASDGDDSLSLPDGDCAVLLNGPGAAGDSLAALLRRWPADSVHEIDLAGSNALEQALSGITLFDWAAFYLAP